MGEVNTALRAKGEECSKLVTECDLLAAQLAEQKELLKKAQEEADRKEAALLTEFESERSSWTDKEAQLIPASMRLRTSSMVSFLVSFEPPTVGRADF